MKAATLLIFLLSHQGYWFSGQDQTVEARWVAKEPMPAADLVWELDLGPVKVAGGAVAMKADEGPTTVTLQAPDVRVRTALRWTYQVVRRDGKDGKKVLESGEHSVFLFPNNLTDDWAKRLGEKKLVVWDDPDGLPKLLESAKVPFTRVKDLSSVLDRPDLIVVGPDKIDASPFSQGPLVRLAEAGSSIAVLEQRRPQRLAGYPLARREGPPDLRFKADHPLFDRLTPGDLKSWFPSDPTVLWAVQLPADEPALELAWWPRESPGEQPAPIDAVLLTKTVGAGGGAEGGPGRIVLCQVPLGPWGQDPRSQLFAGNLLSYLCTRPEPTPPPGERRGPKTAGPPTVPTIEISPGAKP